MGATSRGAKIEDGPPTIQQVHREPTKVEIFAQHEDALLGRAPPNPPPGGGNGGEPGTPGQPNTYVGDLFQITKSTHTLPGDNEHPELKGLSALAAHLARKVELMARGWAAEENAALQARHNGEATDMYQVDRPVIVYTTDMPTTLGRGWGPDGVDLDGKSYPGETGRWTGKLSDFFAADGVPKAGHQVKEDFDLPGKVPPTYVSTVNPVVGTVIEARKPISDKVRQYKLGSVVSSWFSNKKNLG